MLSIISGIIPATRDSSWTAENSVCNWKGVQCTDTFVTTVGWINMGLCGAINLAVLPPRITTFQVDGNYLTASAISWTRFHANLTNLYLSHNNFQGTIDVSSLPSGMQSMDISNNLFTGTPNFGALRWQLTLIVKNNNFCGTMINADQLDFSGMCIGGSDPTQADGHLVCPACDPKQQTSDVVSLLNTVSGITNKDATWLPTIPACSWAGVTCTSGVVTGVDWSSMGLRGALNVTLPRLTTAFNIDTNALSSLAMRSSQLPATLSTMDLSNNNFQGTIDVSSLPSGMQSMDISNNLFTGTPNFGALPSQVMLDVESNNFCGTMINAQQVNQVSGMCIPGSDPTQADGHLVCPACDPKQQASDLASSDDHSEWAREQDATWLPTIPACSWAGVTCTRGVVTGVDWSSILYTGVLNMTLPRFTSSFSFSRNIGRSILGWKRLPAFLTSLDFSQNAFGGTPDLS